MLSQRATNAVLSLLFLGAALTTAGCASDPRTASQGSKSEPLQSQAGYAATVAAHQVGVPYVYGGSDQQGFDCSGLVYYAYASAGKRIARTTAGLWNTLQPVSRNELQAGDVLFFNIEGKVSHVGMYLGHGQFVHAPSTGRHVVIANLGSSYYRRALVRGGRPD